MNASAQIHLNKPAPFIFRYMLISVRFLAYCSGLFFFGVIAPFLSNVVPNSLLRSLILFAIGVIEFEIITKIVKKQYIPKFDRSNMTKSEIEFRETNEKLIQQLFYFFILDLIIAVAVYFFGNLDSIYLTLIGFGFAGSVIAFFHFFGVVILSLKLEPTNNLTWRSPTMFLAYACLIPGFAYAFLTIYSSFYHFENLLK